MSGRGELQVCRNPEVLAEALADLFITTGSLAMADRGAFRVALAGGSTPRAAYELLSLEPRREQLSWSDVLVYFGDERCVPPTDEQSNYRMAEKAFLRSVPIPKANVHRIAGEADPGHAANEYASVLRADLGNAPQFDLVMLGLGPDGHTASLFPGASPEVDDQALVRAVYAKSQMMWRVTITPKVINLARTVVVALEGPDKAAAFAMVYQGPIDPVKYPAQIVNPVSGRLIWLVDELAAGMLKSRH
ncbi:MAG TPA: 6-phosphogluconolactonase [Candidatus Dormibacteraeota bacterium]|nr:6-phosphogluconolactonase [Candidatus Dormibacteraeota bacterium]